MAPKIAKCIIECIHVRTVTPYFTQKTAWHRLRPIYRGLFKFQVLVTINSFLARYFWIEVFSEAFNGVCLSLYQLYMHLHILPPIGDRFKLSFLFYSVRFRMALKSFLKDPWGRSQPYMGSKSNKEPASATRDFTGDRLDEKHTQITSFL